MKRYRVDPQRKQQILNFIYSAVEKSGGTIVHEANPSFAPFEIGICTADQERIDLICYAFYANSKFTRNRPENEHRLQVKYGSEANSLHQLFFDPTAQRVTLFFGAHLERDLFIACDPDMHDPTRFFKSIEFKEEHVQAGLKEGWHGWERDRRVPNSAKKFQDSAGESLQAETLLAFTPENFLHYIRFERAATGMDPGTRLLLIKKMLPNSRGKRHPLEIAYQMSALEILEIIGAGKRLQVAVRGGIAEAKLGNHLRSLKTIDNIIPNHKSGPPDFTFQSRGRTYKIECKNVRAVLDKGGRPWIDFQKTRASKKDPCSRYYRVSDFDLLAACLFPVRERWGFLFCRTKQLRRHADCCDRFHHQVIVSGEAWTSDLSELL